MKKASISKVLLLQASLMCSILAILMVAALSHFDLGPGPLLLAALVCIAGILLLEPSRDRRRVASGGAPRGLDQAWLPPHEVNRLRYSGDGFEVYGQIMGAGRQPVDFCEVFDQDPERLGLALGKVGGQGVPAALFRSRCRTLLAGTLGCGDSPGRAVTALNHELCSQDGQNFASLECATYDPHRGLLDIVSAAHRAALLLRDGRLTSLATGNSLPVGLTDDGQWRSHRYRLRPGDQVIFFSDGAVEAQNTNRECFGMGRLSQVLAQGWRPRELPARIRRAVLDFADGQSDDITVLVLKVSQTSQRMQMTA
ncbi:MAG: serine/threonine-protein phosphatase [Candidatus Eremiobacteraeota bacterium]|nr:serine/threonine-protein phosphatase [Candidatus Eremiobacteraeota bacterium]